MRPIRVLVMLAMIPSGAEDAKRDSVPVSKQTEIVDIRSRNELRSAVGKKVLVTGVLELWRSEEIGLRDGKYIQIRRGDRDQKLDELQNCIVDVLGTLHEETISEGAERTKKEESIGEATFQAPCFYITDVVSIEANRDELRRSIGKKVTIKGEVSFDKSPRISFLGHRIILPTGSIREDLEGAKAQVTGVLMENTDVEKWRKNAKSSRPSAMRRPPYFYMTEIEIVTLSKVPQPVEPRRRQELPKPKAVAAQRRRAAEKREK